MTYLLLAIALTPHTPSYFADFPIGKILQVTGKCSLMRKGIAKPIKISRGLQVIHGDVPSAKGSASAKFYCFDDCSTNDIKDAAPLTCKSAIDSANDFLDILGKGRGQAQKVAFNSPLGWTGKGFGAEECLAKILACRPEWWSSPIIVKDGLNQAVFQQRVDMINANQSINGSTYTLALADLYVSRGTSVDRDTAYRKIQQLETKELSVPERIQIGDIYLYNFNFQGAEEFYAGASKQARDDEDELGEAIATMGVMFIKMAQNQDAEAEKARAIQLLETLNLKDIASLLKKEKDLRGSTQ